MGELHRVCKNFTRHDKKTRTILLCEMLEYTNVFLEAAFRAVRYKGSDEAYAVNELYQKMKERVAVQKAHQQPKAAKPVSGPTASAQQKQSEKALSKTLFSIFLIAIIAIIPLSVIFALIGESGPSTGYYTYGDQSYYYYSGDWYEWEDNSWQYAPSQSWMDSDYENYYDSYSYDSDAEYEDFEDSSYYTPYEYSDDNNDSWDDDSWDSGWDSNDSWDSGYDDWGSDW